VFIPESADSHPCCQPSLNCGVPGGGLVFNEKGLVGVIYLPFRTVQEFIKTKINIKLIL
jgi:hypothetical protein